MPRTVRPARTVATAAALAIALAALGGCAILAPGADRPDPAHPAPASSSAPSSTGTAGSAEALEGEPPPLGVAPTLETDPPLVIMTEEAFSRVNTVQGLTWARSTPDGTWKVGKGFPVEFPVGLPLYPDRWVDGYPLIIESDGVLMLSYTFWGGYAEVDAILAELRSMGFSVESQILETRQAHVAENDEFRLVFTVAEGVTDIQEPSRVYDPQYNYNVKFLTVPYSEPQN